MFSFFLVLSVFIWFLNALGKNYTTFIDYPVEYTDFPVNKVFVGDLPDQLNLRVNAHGYALLRYKLINNSEPIVFNVSSFAMNRVGSDTTRSFILTRYIKDQVSRQLSAELQLLDVKPDSLQFRFANRGFRTVQIEPNLIFEIDKQFTIKDGVLLTPDSVTITGPDFIVDTLSKIFTERSELGVLSKSYKGKVGLSGLDYLDYNISEVYCDIELERFTEMQFYIPVEVLNLPDSMKMQTFPSRVQVICNVGLSQYDRIDKNLFQATVDYFNRVEGSAHLQVNLVNTPVFVRSLDYNPKTIEFLLIEK